MTIHSELVPNTSRLVFALQSLLRQLLSNRIEMLRPCRTACLMILGGMSPNSVPDELTEQILREQRKDGGWVGPDDTLWAILYLKLVQYADVERIQRAVEFLRNTRSDEYGWGRSERDIPRIPVTGRILFFMPELCTGPYVDGLIRLWNTERNSLTYKASFTLAALHTANVAAEHGSLVSETIEWLASQQNEDGGFSPWKGHPVGSDIFCTAIASLGLTMYPTDVSESVLCRSLLWMKESQLGNGLWAYHQIEDGSAWGFYAIRKIMAVLSVSYH